MKKQYKSHVQFIASTLISDYNKHYDDGNGKYRIRYTVSWTWDLHMKRGHPVRNSSNGQHLTATWMSIIFFHGLCCTGFAVSSISIIKAWNQSRSKLRRFCYLIIFLFSLFFFNKIKLSMELAQGGLLANSNWLHFYHFAFSW
jgi:hypothetical protein